MTKQSESREALLQSVQNADEIVVIGGGGHAKVVVSILRKLKRYSVLGYTDLKDHGALLGAPYLGSDRELVELAAGRKKLNVVLAVGQVGLGEARRELWTRLQSADLLFPLIVSPDAKLNEGVSGGEGAVVMDGSVINTGAAIGRCAIVNTNSTIEHDVVLEDWVHVAPGATISGGVTVGRFSMIGAGATVIEGRKIASGCIVGAGATVVCDLTEPGVYVGSPARRVNRNPMPHVFIIAEAGVNHNGSLDLALRLVDAAKASGADAVKFQTFRADLLATRSAHKAPYQKRTTTNAESQFDMLQRLELDAAAHERLIGHCRQIGIEFLSSPFDMQSADLLATMGVPRYKIPSGEITNLPFLQHLARKGRPLILSTGMSTLGEVEEAVNVLQAAGSSQLTLLHCVTEYPAPYAEVNLRAMLTLKSAFGLPVGYSDHTPGIEIAVAAAALGAEVIEKHFTLDRSLPGPDHAASLEPVELRQMVTAIRHVEAALGTGVKAPAPCELPNISVARKSVVAARALPAGHRFASSDLDIKRPGNGLAPKFLPVLIGRTLRAPVAKDEILSWDHLA